MMFYFLLRQFDLCDHQSDVDFFFFFEKAFCTQKTKISYDLNSKVAADKQLMLAQIPSAKQYVNSS